LNATELRYILKRPIAFYPIIGKICGDAATGLFLSQCLYWSDKSSDLVGWFWKTQEEWTEETCLSRREQETARARLKELNILEENHVRIEHRLYFRVDLEKLSSLVNATCETYIPECPKPPLGGGGNEQPRKAESAIPKRTESTSETTSREREVEVLNYQAPTLYLEMVDSLRALERIWKDHPRARFCKWEEPKFSSSFGHTEASIGKEPFRRAWVEYLNSQETPTALGFLYTQPKPPRRQRGSRPSSTPSGLSDSERLKKLLGRSK